MSYVITGSPGTGKHTVGKMLAEKLRLEIADINLLAAKSGLCKEIDGVIEVDTKDLSKVMENASGVIIGHLAPYVIKQAETVIVLRKNPYELEKIYSQRNYSKEKTLENIQAEINNFVSNLDKRSLVSTSITPSISLHSPDFAASKLMSAISSLSFSASILPTVCFPVPGLPVITYDIT